MASDKPQLQRDEIDRAARDRSERISRIRQAAERIDRNPSLLAAARRMRQALPGDERFGDPLSTAGRTPVQVVGRGVSALSPKGESVVQELGLAGLQIWQSLSEGTSRGPEEHEVALLFTDLVGFSSWALEAGDAATLELLREVGTAVESAILAHDGRIVKRLGDGLMATFLTAQDAVDAALDAQAAVKDVSVEGYRPRMRAGVHWGQPVRIGGDYIGVDVNIAARVGDAGRADQVMLSDAALERIELTGLRTGRKRRLKADGAPRELQVVSVRRAPPPPPSASR